MKAYMLRKKTAQNVINFENQLIILSHGIMTSSDLPYPYYFYGSHDSEDEDVIISIPQEVMPALQEDRKRLMHKLGKDYELPFNATLAVIENGIMVDTIFPKTWVDSLNNALFTTYNNHLEKQVYDNPITQLLPRNKLLAIYRSVRTVLSMFSRTDYRTVVKPILKGCHDFQLKINALKQLNFLTIESFNQSNGADIDIWKTLAFYIGQNMSLVTDDIEIYTKKDLVKHYPDLTNFIYRNPLDAEDLHTLNRYLREYVLLLESYGPYDCNDIIMTCKGETIDMRDEVSL
jgi:hypothetical protein